MKKTLLLSMLALVCIAGAAQNRPGPQIPMDPISLPASDLYTVEQRDITNSEGKNLYGIAFIPKTDGKKKVPLVIMSHGFGSSHTLFTTYGQTLAENGIAAYCFDFYGGSPRTRSEGTMAEMSVLTEKSDLESVFKTASAWEFVDRKNIFLCGESQGGFVSALAGASLGRKVRGMILFYPAFHIPVTMLKIYPERNPQHVNYPEFMGAPVSVKYPIEAFDLNSSEICRNFKGDVLIMHGDEDALVDLRYAIQAQKDYPHASLKIIEGANHGFFDPEQIEKVKGYMLGFLAEQTK